MNRIRDWGIGAGSARVLALGLGVGRGPPPAGAAADPALSSTRSTGFKWLRPNDQLAPYGLDDPAVERVACHFTVPERGGFKGWIGVAEEVSHISPSCRQIGPIKFK